MSRDHRQLDVFRRADALVVDIYKHTNDFPSLERYGLQAQIRRAAVSVTANLVEGSARRSTRDYLNFINIAAGSASETRYLVDLSGRLGFMDVDVSAELTRRYTIVCGQLAMMIQTLSPKP